MARRPARGANSPWRGGFGPGTEVAKPEQAACGRNAAFARPCTRPLFGSRDATGTSTEHTTCRVRRSSSGRPLRHVARLADAPQVRSDARRLRDKHEQLHPSAAAWAGQNVEPKRPFEKLRPRTVGASARALGHVRRGFCRSHHRLRRETGPQLTRRREHPRVPNGMQARCGHRRRETAEERQRIQVPPPPFRPRKAS